MRYTSLDTFHDTYFPIRQEIVPPKCVFQRIFCFGFDPILELEGPPFRDYKIRAILDIDVLFSLANLYCILLEHGARFFDYVYVYTPL